MNEPPPHHKETNNHLIGSMLDCKDLFDYSVNVSSDHIYRTHHVDDLFRKLISIVTLKLDRKLLKTKKPHLLPPEKRTAFILFPESISKADGKPCIAHLHGFLKLPDVELSSFEEGMAVNDLRWWLQVYLLKFGLVRMRNRKNHNAGTIIKLEEDEMREALIDYAMKFQDENCIGEAIFIGANVFNPFA